MHSKVETEGDGDSGDGPWEATTVAESTTEAAPIRRYNMAGWTGRKPKEARARCQRSSPALQAIGHLTGP